ncbi:hypothetical protein [Caballeronia arvi]|nr:hypothetical protein [Caballeronia arvi]
MNGMHLEPGREYYFPPSAPYFDYDYFQVKPVDAAEIEQDELIGIGTVRSDQKRDYMYGYRRVRTKYTPRIDTAALRLVRNGDYFLSVDETGRAANLVSIDEAIRLPKYVKVTVYLQKVVEAELVDRVGETHVQFKYWTTTGYRQELVSFDIDEGVRTDHRLCYAEADGRRTPCSDSQKKP